MRGSTSSEPALSGKSSTRRTRRGPRTRKQILDASLRLFSERGFARTTVRDIARQAGITDAAIYYHFQSKRELLEALVEERGFIHSLLDLEQVPADLPLRETLVGMAQAAIAVMDENRDFLRLIIMEGLGGDEAASEQYQRLVNLWERALASILQRYMEKGELSRQDPNITARQVIYPILMAFQETLLGRGVYPQTPTRERRQALAAFVADTIDRLFPRT